MAFSHNEPDPFTPNPSQLYGLICTGDNSHDKSLKCVPTWAAEVGCRNLARKHLFAKLNKALPGRFLSPFIFSYPNF